jgi:5-hydroxytryptamine receptor 2
MLRNKGFIIYGSILAFFIPLVIMVVSYGLTIRLLYKQSKLYDPSGNPEQSGQPILRRVKSSRQHCKEDLSTSQVRRSFSTSRDDFQYEMCSRSGSQIHISRCGKELPISSFIPQSASCNVVCSSPVSPVADSSRCFLSVPGHHKNGTSSESLISDNETYSDDDGKSCSHFTPAAEMNRKGSLRQVMAKQIIVKASSILNLARAKNSDKTRVRTEQKASKVLGFVFAIFVMCWAPFFVVNILRVLCKECAFNNVLLSTCMWLGWISSTINPIIYTMFNCTFKQTFMKLVKCQFGFLQKPHCSKINTSNKEQYDMNIPL